MQIRSTRSWQLPRPLCSEHGLPCKVCPCRRRRCRRCGHTLLSPLLSDAVNDSERFASLKACELDVQNAALKVHAICETSLQSSALAWIHGRVQVSVKELMEDIVARLSQHGGRSETASCAVQPSRAQRRIIECPHSLFLQGRSGTGKTVCIIHRILRARRQFPVAKRLFVTRSSLLCAQAGSVQNAPAITHHHILTSPQVLEQLAVFGSTSRDAAVLRGSSGGTPVCPLAGNYA